MSDYLISVDGSWENDERTVPPGIVNRGAMEIYRSIRDTNVPMIDFRISAEEAEAICDPIFEAMEDDGYTPDPIEAEQIIAEALLEWAAGQLD